MLLKDKPEMPSPEDAEQISLAKKSSEDRPISITKARLPRPKVPFWKLPAQTWNNIGVRWKLSILLLVASGLPVLIVTQTLVKASEQSTLRELRTSVKEKGSFFGINTAACSDMCIFIHNNKVERSTMLSKPDATMHPVKTIPIEALRLSGFQWRSKERPRSKMDVVPH
jgi:hypothetical protein